MTAEKAFKEYTDRYREYGEKVLLKIDHSMRVRDLCTDIAGSLGMNGPDIELAADCGLIHDIGRFEQWRRYQTYNDQRSEDHGDLGAEVLAGMIDDFRRTDQVAILNTVRYHNKFSVPEDLDERDRVFVNITRDADKIDILDLFVTGGLVKQTRNTAMSDHAYRLLLNKKALRKQDAQTKADAIAGYLAFVFDMNYQRSFEIMTEKDLINRLIDKQKEETANQDLIWQLERAREVINGYVCDRLPAGGSK